MSLNKLQALTRVSKICAIFAQWFGGNICSFNETLFWNLSKLGNEEPFELEPVDILSLERCFYVQPDRQVGRFRHQADHTASPPLGKLARFPSTGYKRSQLVNWSLKANRFSFTSRFELIEYLLEFSVCFFVVFSYFAVRKSWNQSKIRIHIRRAEFWRSNEVWAGVLFPISPRKISPPLNRNDMSNLSFLIE